MFKIVKIIQRTLTAKNRKKNVECENSVNKKISAPGFGKMIL